MSDTTKDTTAKGDDSSKAPKPPPEESAHTTAGEVTIDGQLIKYDATVGTYIIKKEDGEARASMFYTYYERTDKGGAERPITFAFNGGPGSSSVWLHVGALGPKMVDQDDEHGLEITPPYRLVENPHSILDRTDIVFIDPVTTGFSRGVDDEKAKEFHGFKGDLEAMGEFVRLFLTRQGRWASPKYLAGESYGTLRAAGLAHHLMEKHTIYVDGCLMISSILNYQTVSFDPGNDLPYILHLPTYAAIAHYHGKVKGDVTLKAHLRDAEAFARGPYAEALMKGSKLTEGEERRVVRKLSALTGLKPEWLRGSNLRIEILRFTRELLRDSRRSVGRLDGRFKGIEADAVGETMTFHPSLAVITGAYAACLNDYLTRELGYKCDLPYNILTDRVHPWDFSDFTNKYLDVSASLARTISMNPHMHVYVGSGYYDIGTPYFASDYTYSHLGLEKELQDRVHTYYYESGHMLYIHRESLKAMRRDILEVMSKSQRS